MLIHEGSTNTEAGLESTQAVVVCADCHYWDGHDDSMGTCTRLPDGRYVQVPIDDHVQLRLITSDDFGCSLGKRIKWRYGK